MKLEEKLVGLVMPFVVLPLMAFGWMTYQQLREKDWERSLGQTHARLAQVRDAISARLEYAAADLTLLADAAPLRPYRTMPVPAELAESARRQALALFQQYQSVHPEYSEIRLLSPDGTPLLRSAVADVSDAGGRAEDSEWFRALRKAGPTTYRALFRNPATGRNALLLARAIEADGPGVEGRAVRGYLVLVLEADFIEQQLRRSAPGGNGRLFLADAQGRVAFDPDLRRVGESLGPGSGAWLSPLADGESAFSRVVAGEPVRLLGQRAPLGLYVVSALPETDFAGDRGWIGISVLLIMGVAIVLTVSVLLVLLRRLMLSRVRQLHDAALAVGRGEYRVAVPETGGDELAELARAFALMGRSLELSREQLLAQQRETELRAQDLDRARREAERGNRAKDEFLAAMSHELRTPLTAILGMSDVLVQQYAGPLNDKQTRYLGTIQESGQHLLSLINDILDLAKIEAGGIELEPARVDIPQLVEACLRLVGQCARNKNLRLVSEVDPMVTQIVADGRRLKQAIVNLLSNAVKFTPEGGSVGLQVKGSEAGERLLITVWDTGIGIKQEDYGKLFQPFQQLDSRLNRQYDGTGLGLALVKRLADMHGGTVELDSEPGRGSRFTILLPWSTPASSR